MASANVSRKVFGGEKSVRDENDRVLPRVPRCNLDVFEGIVPLRGCGLGVRWKRVDLPTVGLLPAL